MAYDEVHQERKKKSKTPNPREDNSTAGLMTDGGIWENIALASKYQSAANLGDCAISYLRV
jgi:hypothetical protein